MKEVSLQIQSVIYKNKVKSLKKAVCGIANSIRVANDNGLHITGVMTYGDASPKQVLSEKDIEEIRAILPKEMEFKYNIFGFNTGTAKGHNLMAENCRAEYMMIMNPDIILSPTCMYELFKPFKKTKVVMTEARQTPLEHGKEYNTITGETEWASTACTIFKTQIYNEVKGFDADTFFMYCDDLDFSWRVRLQGYKIIYNPRAVVYHAKTLSLDAGWVPTSAEIYYSAEAALLLAYKWSNFTRVKKILKQYEQYGGKDEKRAAAEFRRRIEQNRLPEPIDGNHEIARFVEDNYSKMRFKMG